MSSTPSLPPLGQNSSFLTYSGVPSTSTVFAASATRTLSLTENVLDLTQCDGPVIIRTKDGDINVSKLAAMMSKLDRLLCVVEQAVKLDPNNETLMSAYEQFRMVEELSK